MFKKSQQAINFINEEVQPADFVIDLKKQFEQSNKENKFRNTWQSLGKFNLSNQLKKIYLKYQYQFKQLTFFFVFEYLFLLIFSIIRLIYKLSYYVGWLAIFIIRFIGQIFFYVSKLFIKATSKLLNSKISLPTIQLYKQKKKFQEKIETAAVKVTIKDKAIKPIEKEPEILIPDITREPIKELSLGAKLKPAFAFAIILFISVLPFKAITYINTLNLGDLKGRVLGITETAINDLTNAGDSIISLDFNQASQDFVLAGNNFLKAQNELNEINDLLFILASFVPDQELQLAANAESILAAGQAAADLGNSLSIAMDSIFNSNEDLMQILDDFNKYGNKAIISAENLNDNLNKINTNALPLEYQQQFIFIKNKAIFLEKSFREFIDIVAKIQIFIGANQDKRYLLVFQNNTEMRASGGFIGSYALVDLRDGKIKNIEVPEGGSYDTEAGLYEQIIAPEPLHLVDPLWHFWDANWWPDWPKSATKLMWFYERSNGPTVDGVIAFTPTVIEKILAVIGPIDMTTGAGVSPATILPFTDESYAAAETPAATDYGVTIDAENFWLTTQTITEQNSPENGKPKKIIGDLMNKIIEELPARLNKDSMIDLMIAMEESLSEKHILFYFNDQELQQKITDLGWSGKVKQTNWDYLMVVNTNIAGAKSDKKIIQTINHQAEILADGTIIDTLEIKRTHNGIKNELFSGLRNVNWLRVYVPLGSELIEASGFSQPDDIYFESPEENWQADPELFNEEGKYQTDLPSMTKIYEESWKTVFANWTMVDPGETVIINFKYKLPFKLEKTKESYKLVDQLANYINPEQKLLYPYALLAQKQPGSMNSQINSVLKLPDNFDIVWHYPDEININPGGWIIKDDLLVDKYWAIVMEMHN